MSSGPGIVTFGCRVNAWESEAIRARAGDRGDLVVINTCAVTAEAERQARQAIRRARRDRPGAEIVVTGCAAQIDPERYAAMPEVDRVVGNREKLAPDAFARRAALARPARPRIDLGNIMAAGRAAGEFSGFVRFEGRTRAILHAQTGCDWRCTFCVIPFGRGPSRSAPLGALVAQARALVARGFREIVVSGVDIASWGGDLPAPIGFAAMLRRLLAAVPELPRLRLSSLDPAAVGAPLAELFAAEPRLMPHVHLSAQSGSDMTLKRMKRRHRRADLPALCAALRAARPDIVFGADFIAGFPTETDAMHGETLAAIRECEIALPHVFPYSARPGTPAARMPQVAPAVRRARAAELRAAGAEARACVLARRVGAPAAVLMESETEGRTEQFLRARFAAPQTPGETVRARLTGHDGESFHAEAA